MKFPTNRRCKPGLRKQHVKKLEIGVQGDGYP